MPIIWSPDALRVSSSVRSPAPMILMPELARPRSANCLAKTPPAAGEINERRIRIDIAYPLQEGGKIRISERDEY